VPSLPRNGRRRAGVNGSPDGPADPTVRLAEVRGAMAVLYCGLASQWAEILADDDIEPGLIPADTHDTMRLPSSCSRFGSARENRGWYEVAVAHRAGHYAWSSFGLDIGPVLARLGVTHDDGLDLITGTDGASLGPWASFFSMFRRVELAGTVFGAVEDTRVDTRLPALVPGFRDSLAQVVADELARRPPIESFGPRDQALEVLQRMSLGFAGTLPLDPAVRAAAGVMAELLPMVRSRAATVIDSAVVAALVYGVIDDLPILSAAAPVATAIEPPATGDGPVPLPGCFIGIFAPDVDVARLEGEERLRSNVPPVSFRDIVGLRFQGINHGSSGVKSELLIFKPGRHIVDEHYDQRHAHDHEHDHDETPPGGTPEPLPHEHYEVGGTYYRERARGGEQAGGTYLYPEWDGISRRYRPNWVTLKEEVPHRGPSAADLLASVSELSATERRITGELERIADMGRVLVRRVRDGDEVDIDGTIEALVELRAGQSADPRPYARIDRARRDVAVGIVLDLSSSTAERIDASSTAPPRTNRDGSARRIIDVEREAVALLLRSLARLGDSVGVYGFSGSGRHDVRVLTVKDFREPLSIRTFERMAGLKPIHMTRLAPVIRHVSRKLAAEASETRLLLVISDGRPFDLDYGAEHPGHSIEYANLDTQVAVEEALAQGIEPFVLTVDSEGNEYLSEVFEMGGGYEVVANIEDLRAALVRSYTRVRTGASRPRGPATRRPRAAV
jgi:nitric oxide reductase NorD protein